MYRYCINGRLLLRKQWVPAKTRRPRSTTAQSTLSRTSPTHVAAVVAFNISFSLTQGRFASTAITLAPYATNLRTTFSRSSTLYRIIVGEKLFFCSKVHMYPDETRKRYVVWNSAILEELYSDFSNDLYKIVRHNRFFSQSPLFNDMW